MTASPPTLRNRRLLSLPACVDMRQVELRADIHGAACRHGADIHAISKELGTRTTTQVRTHIQKYHLKLVRGMQGCVCARVGYGLSPAE